MSRPVEYARVGSCSRSFTHLAVLEPLPSAEPTRLTVEEIVRLFDIPVEMLGPFIEEEDVD